MRSRFPVLWLLQAALLLLWGASCLLAPEVVLWRYSGEVPPPTVERPVRELNAWVLAIDDVPATPEKVQTFFTEHEIAQHEVAEVWTPLDPSIHREEWDATIDWILSFQPSPPARDLTMIRRWFRAVDEFEQPPPELAKWVHAHSARGPPTSLLLTWLLDAHHRSPMTWQLATDQTRARAPILLAVALFTVLGLLSPSIRRPLARIFALMFLFWCAAQLRGMLGPPEWHPRYILLAIGFALGVGLFASRAKACPGRAFCWTALVLVGTWAVVSSVKVLEEAHPRAAEIAFALGAALVLVNAYYWLGGESEDPPQDDAGIAQSRPPQLWTTWGIQFVVFFAMGMTALLFPDATLRLFTADGYDHLGTELVDDQVRLAGAAYVNLALLSFFALRAMPDVLWRGIAWTFCTVFVLIALQTVLNASSGEYTVWMFLFGLQGLLFVPITLKLLRRDDPWFADNVEKEQRGWSPSDLAVGLPLLWAAVFRRRRRLFATGVGATGHLVVLPPPLPDDMAGIPASTFFVPGSELRITLRFSNRWFDDDAALDIRGCGLELRHLDTDESLCLLLATGAFSPVRDIGGFRALLSPGRGLATVVERRRSVREGLAAGLRRAPASYFGLAYHSQTVRHWISRDGARALARFRLVPEPAPDGSATGVLSGEELESPLPTGRLPGESRPKDYLRQDVVQRLGDGGVAALRLDVQIHDPNPADSDVWYDPTAEWPEASHPWRPLGRIELARALSENAAEALHFDPGTRPQSLGVPKASGADDPRWLGVAQRRVVASLMRQRLRARVARRRDAQEEK